MGFSKEEEKMNHSFEEDYDEQLAIKNDLGMLRDDLVAEL